MTNYQSVGTVRIALLAVAGVSAAVPASAGSLLDATRRDNVQRVEQIVHSGADVDERGPQGDMPLHWAAFRGSTAAVAHLIAGGAEVNARVRDGNTPLHQATYRGHLDVVELLIRHGAAVNARTQAGITPLDWAMRNGHREVERLLIAHGARPGRAPLNQPSGLRQDNVALPRRAEAQPDNVMIAAMQALPALRSAARQRARVPEAQRSNPEPLTSLAQTRQFRVQLVAMSDEAGARRMWEAFRRRHSDVLAGLELALETAEVDGRSYYRVQAGPLSRTDALSACNSLAQSGQSCLVTRGR